MISGEHSGGFQKHAKLARPSWGAFGRNELAIVGTPCPKIKEMAFRIIEFLAARYKLAYVDADHKSAEEEKKTGKPAHTALANGARMELTDKISHTRFDYKSAPNTYATKQFFNDVDMTLVNGNHFEAAAQIVVIDEKKPLDQKLHKLTNVRLFVLTETVSEIPQYLKDHLENYESIPVHFFNETDKLGEFVEKEILKSAPALNGLVLAGGKSRRMRQDKGKLEYHGKPQREFVYDLLSEYCKETFVSVRADQIGELDARLNYIADAFTDLGPLGAILSAFRYNPDAAWLVAATDLPYLNVHTIEHLIKSRDLSKCATAYRQPGGEFPEPLIAIWEPRAYLTALSFLSLGYSCPRKTLINSDTRLIEPLNDSDLMNVNFPEEYESAVKNLKNGR